MATLIEDQLRARARTLLAEGTVDLFVGYRQGSNPLRVVPFVARTPAETERLVWNVVCVPNLAGTLLKHAGRRVGVTLKGCDVRSVVQLITQHQLERERLHIIGVTCRGMADTDQLAAIAEGPVSDITEDGDELLLSVGAEMSRHPQDNLFLAKCAICTSQTPELYDELVGEAIPVAPVADRRAGIHFLDALDAPGRLAFWSEQLSKCTLCYACQAVCPLCYCKQCPITLPRDDPRKQARELTSVFSYHMMRASHLTGRCTGCDECERVCPENIPLSLICRKIEQDGSSQ